MVEAGEDEDERVGVEAARGVAHPHAVGDPPRRRAQDAVAERAPQPAVDLREPVEVDVEDAHPGPVAVGLRDRHGQAVGDEHGAREPGHRVVVGVADQDAVVGGLAEEDLDRLPAPVGDRGRGPLDLGGRPVGAAQPGREPPPAASRLRRAGERPRRLRPLVGVEEVGEGAAGHRHARLQAEEPAQGRVGEDDPAGGLDQDRVGGRGGEPLVALLALVERVGRPPALGRVPQGELQPPVGQPPRAHLDLEGGQGRTAQAVRPREPLLRRHHQQSGHGVDRLVRLDEVGELELQEGGPRAAEEGGGARARVGDPSVGGDDQDAVGGLLRQEAVLLVALAQHVHDRPELVGEARVHAHGRIPAADGAPWGDRRHSRRKRLWNAGSA